MPIVSFDEAVTRLSAGGLVALPTETVYGLAADGLDGAAVTAIFAAKGRPAHHPLILHVLDDPDAHGVADARARALAARFWPGPLTLVMPARAHVPRAVTGGAPTVAVRAPAHPLARRVLAAVGRPLAAPSANRFGRTSPTTAAHVLAEDPGWAVLDGGPCDVGVESTIVDLSGPRPALLRPGGLAREELEEAIGPLEAPGATPAPGTLAAHYAPRTPLVVADDAEAAAETARARGLVVGVVPALAPVAHARTLFATLRALDGTCDLIVAQRAAPGGLGDAINDRLQRAAAAHRTPHLE
jgi:L-threonylcarbamoyladenylate synthase